MNQKNRKEYLLPIILKLTALLMGYALWHVFGQTQTIAITRTVPVCFDNHTHKQIITGPESVTITLKGKRSDFLTFDVNSLAAHINVAHLTSFQTVIQLARSHLFLPEHILLVHYDPAPIIIEMSEEKEENQEQQGVNG